MGRTTIVYAALGIGSVCVSSWGCESSKSPVEPSPVCSFAIAPASQAFTEAGGSGSMAVATTAGCSWSAASSAGWIAVTAGSTGAGPAAVTYTVQANEAPDARTGTVTVEGQRHTVTQSGRSSIVCSFELDPQSVAVGKDAADGAFSVITTAGCAWTATSTAPWLVVAGGAAASGPGRVSYAIARNTSFEPRDAGITVGARTFAVHQAGDAGVPRGLGGVWSGRLIDYPGGRTFQMTLEMNGDLVFGRITGEGTGGFGYMMGVYPGTGPVHLVADFGDGKQYFDGEFEGRDRVVGASTYNQRPPVYRFEMSR